MSIFKSVRANRRGLTLIELVVVLVIVAVLAGVAIPLVSMLTRSGNMAGSASNQKELANNIELYFTLQKRFPQGLDSLITAGTPAIYASDTTDANTQTIGLPYAGADGTRLQAQLQVTALTNGATPGTADYLRSFTRSGFDYVFDHDTAVINASNSGTSQRALSGSSVNVAEVIPWDGTGTAPTGSTPGSLAAKLLPGGVPATSKLVALGIGPRNLAIGKTLMNAPVYPGSDGKYYGRFIAVFQVYASGERATLVGVIDPYGRTADYTVQQFNESLPNGARQD